MPCNKAQGQRPVWQRAFSARFDAIYTYLFTVYVGTLPLGLLPPNMESLGLPTFEAGSGSGAAPLAAATAAPIQGLPAADMSIPKGNRSQPQVPCFGAYSPTARLPRKPVARIQSLEFIEASKMLQETWWPDTQERSPVSHRQLQRSSVTESLVWAECFALMAAVLAQKCPMKSPQLWAYLHCIIHAAQNYQGLPWVAYDRAYHHQALAQGSLDWAQEDSALYIEAFVGHAKLIARCRHCLSKFHATEACPELSGTLPLWPTPYPAGPSQVLAPPQPLQEICRKFNQNNCLMRRCRYLHACLGYGHPHPVILCNTPPGNPGPGRFVRDHSPLRPQNRNPHSHHQ